MGDLEILSKHLIPPVEELRSSCFAILLADLDDDALRSEEAVQRLAGERGVLLADVHQHLGAEDHVEPLLQRERNEIALYVGDLSFARDLFLRQRQRLARDID